jgi:hypothetical protein
MAQPGIRERYAAFVALTIKAVCTRVAASWILATFA